VTGLGIITPQPGGDGEHDTSRAWTLARGGFPRRANLFPAITRPSSSGRRQPEVTRDTPGNCAPIDKYDPHGERAFAFRRADAITAEVMDIGIGTEGGRKIARLPSRGEYDREESPRRVWMTPRRRTSATPRPRPDLPAHFLTLRRERARPIRRRSRGEPPRRPNWIFSDSTSGGRVPSSPRLSRRGWTASACPRRPTTSTGQCFAPTPRRTSWALSYPHRHQEDVYVAANGHDVNSPQRHVARHGAEIVECPDSS